MTGLNWSLVGLSTVDTGGTHALGAATWYPNR